jgi:hypothetical protein
MGAITHMHTHTHTPTCPYTGPACLQACVHACAHLHASTRLTITHARTRMTPHITRPPSSPAQVHDGIQFCCTLLYHLRQILLHHPEWSSICSKDPVAARSGAAASGAAAGSGAAASVGVVAAGSGAAASVVDVAAGSGAAASVGVVAGDWQRVTVPGGYLLWSKNARRLDAHCTCALHALKGHQGCKMDRTLNCRGDVGGNRGRPVGRLLLWLSMGDGLSRDDHRGLKSPVGGLPLHAMRESARMSFSARAESEPLVAAILADERPQRDTEASSEPQVSI